MADDNAATGRGGVRPNAGRNSPFGNKATKRTFTLTQEASDIIDSTALTMTRERGIAVTASDAVDHLVRAGAGMPLAVASSRAPLTDTAFASEIGISLASFYVRKAAGDFRRFELSPQIGGNTRYSWTLVRRWLDGETIGVRSDEQPTRTFFGSAKRRSGRPRTTKLEGKP